MGKVLIAPSWVQSTPGVHNRSPPTWWVDGCRDPYWVHTGGGYVCVCVCVCVVCARDVQIAVY